MYTCREHIFSHDLGPVSRSHPQANQCRYSATHSRRLKTRPAFQIEDPQPKLGVVQIMDRAKAVGAIRAQVYERATGDSPAGGELSECERCGRIIRWETFEMHETIPKGKHGEVSLSNCEALCHACHQGGPDSAHGNRRWHTSKIKSDKGHND